MCNTAVLLRYTQDCSYQLFSAGLLSLFLYSPSSCQDKLTCGKRALLEVKTTRGDCAHCKIQRRMHSRGKYQHSQYSPRYGSSQPELRAHRPGAWKAERGTSAGGLGCRAPDCLHLTARTALTVGLGHGKALSMLGSSPFGELQNTSWGSMSARSWTFVRWIVYMHRQAHYAFAWESRLACICSRPKCFGQHDQSLC